MIRLTLIIVAFSFIACNSDEGTVVPTTKSLTLNLSGLAELGENFVYEGWIIVDGMPVSTGTFSSVEFPQSFTVNTEQLDMATKFVLSIEPMNDTNPAPANTKILAGDFNGNSASVNTMPVGDLSNAMGKYILATPTNGADTNENSGIWFLDPSSGAPMAGLSLPTLPTGWIYEGWVVIDGQPVTTGTFTNTSASDNSAMFSGAMALPMPNGADGFFPGEDYLMMAPSGLTFPTDLSGGKAVISIEPVPDNSSMPFSMKPLVGDIPVNATDHTLYQLGQNLSSLPTGMVSR